MASSKFIVTIIMLVIGLILFGSLIGEVGWQIHGTGITNATINFAVNDTFYAPPRTPIATVTSVQNATYDCPSAGYTFDGIQGIKLLNKYESNCSVGYYNATYTFVKPTGFGGVIVGLMIGILALVIILIYLKKI